MKITKTVYLYYLIGADDIANVVAVNDHSDNICIGARDKDGKYHQYDSYEAWYVSVLAEQHGFKSGYFEKEIELEII